MTVWKNASKKTALMKPYVRIVDDEEDVRTSMALLLRLAGIDVRTYETRRICSKTGSLRRRAVSCSTFECPGMDGLHLQETLIARHVDLPILFLTGHGDVDTAVTVMRRGAVDFIQKPPAPEVFLAAIRKYVAWHERVRAHVVRVSDARAKYETLTLREKEVLRGVAEGLLNKQIAFKYSIGIETVKTYRANAWRNSTSARRSMRRSFTIFIGGVPSSTRSRRSRTKCRTSSAQGVEDRETREGGRNDRADDSTMRIDRNAVRESLLND